MKLLKKFFFPEYKKCKNYTVYRVPHNRKTVIFANFKSDFNGGKIPRGTCVVDLRNNEVSIQDLSGMRVLPFDIAYDLTEGTESNDVRNRLDKYNDGLLDLTKINFTDLEIKKSENSTQNLTKLDVTGFNPRRFDVRPQNLTKLDLSGFTNLGLNI
jgi:hypothetical protein